MMIRDATDYGGPKASWGGRGNWWGEGKGRVHNVPRTVVMLHQGEPEIIIPSQSVDVANDE